MNHQLIGRDSLRIQLLRWAQNVSLSTYKRFFQVLWSCICECSCGARYKRLLVEVSESRAVGMSSASLYSDISALPGCTHTEASGDDMISLKVSLLGDCNVGKTSFMVCAIYDVGTRFWYWYKLVVDSNCMPVLSYVFLIFF
jgi:Rab family, other